jgi:hypothetical protein
MTCKDTNIFHNFAAKFVNNNLSQITQIHTELDIDIFCSQANRLHRKPNLWADLSAICCNFHG